MTDWVVYHNQIRLKVFNVVPPVKGSADNRLVPETEWVPADDVRHHSEAQILELVRL